MVTSSSLVSYLYRLHFIIHKRNIPSTTCRVQSDNQVRCPQVQGKRTDRLKDQDIEESILVDVWMEVESQQYNPAIGPIVMQSVIIPKYGGVPDEKLITSSVEKLEKVLDVNEERLSKTKYLAGDFFSLADLHHLPLTYYLVQLTRYAILISSCPYVKAWWENISSRPTSKKVTANMFSK